MMKPTVEPAAPPVQASFGIDLRQQRLSLWDTTSIIIGIVVGTTIFRSPSLVFQNVAGPWQALAVWLLGGVLCIFGAFCYAELATTYPRNGGDYEYLSRAYGRWMGFLFGWAQLAVILTGSIGIMAYAFADYAAALWNLPLEAAAWLAAAAVAVLTVLNLFGLAVGKSLQNVLTAAKILGLLVIVIAGFARGRGDVFLPGRGPAGLMDGNLGLALVFVLYAYGGWNDAVFVAAEVRDQRRNLPRALIFGIGGITAVYLAVNAAYLAVLGFEAARQTPTPAAAVLDLALGPIGGKLISLMVMVSALGAINGLILAGSRVYAVVGEDHRLFAWLGRWNSKAAAPITSLLAQAAIALVLIFAVGTPQGRGWVDGALTQVGIGRIPWEQYFGGFDTLLAGSAPVFWLFFLLTGISLFVLRIRDPGRERGFAIPWFPLPPIVFCATCLYMLYSSLDYARFLTLLGVVPLLVGLPMYGVSAWLAKRGRAG
ncbi:MAG: amino acid permease [Pirellulales bacterium]|nr:amino acid permease [Pirellulales bacterium]